MAGKMTIPPSCADLDLMKVRRELIRAGGNVTAAARKLGVPVHDLRQTTRATPGLLEAALEAEEQALDKAEAELMRALRSPDPTKRLAAAAYLLRKSPAARRRS
jgi:hypothetical protein